MSFPFYAIFPTQISKKYSIVLCYLKLADLVSEQICVQGRGSLRQCQGDQQHHHHPLRRPAPQHHTVEHCNAHWVPVFNLSLKASTGCTKSSERSWVMGPPGNFIGTKVWAFAEAAERWKLEVAGLDERILTRNSFPGLEKAPVQSDIASESNPSTDVTKHPTQQRSQRSQWMLPVHIQ